MVLSDCLISVVDDSPMNNQVAALASKKRTRTSRSTVPNSSDNDDELLEIDPSMPPAQVRRILKQVSIPIMNTKQAGAAQQADSETSNGTPSIDNSDYDTPGTSISNTPAVSFGRSQNAGRKSGLSKAVTARTRNTVQDTDEEIDTVDLDAELALQMQIEEDEDDHRNKRQRVEEIEDDDEDEVANIYAPRSRVKPATYKGKGKGKAKVESDIETDDDADSLLEELITEPTYTGKGKGKTTNAEVSRRRSRSTRPSMSRNTILDDVMSDLEDSEEEDEFKPEDVGSPIDISDLES